MAEAKISVEIELLDKSSEEFKKFEQKVLRFKGNVEGSLRQVGNAAKTATKDIKALNAQLNDKSGLASNKAAKGLRVTSQNVKQLAPSANAAKIGFGGMTQGMAAFLGVSAGIGGVVVGFKRLIASGREYSVVLAEIATLTDESSFSAGQQRDIVESLADKYGVLQNEVGKGLYQTISAGATEASQATAILTESIGLSIAGVATVKESVDIMTSTLNSYGHENVSAARAADVLFETVKRGKTTMSELASVLGRVLPLAREVGVSFEEVNAAVVSQTKQGASTAEAVTRLRSIFSALIKKQGEVADLFERRLGITFDENTIKAIGLTKTLELLKRATAGNRDELTKLIGRIEGTTGVLALTADNAELLKDALSGIEGASGTAGAALNEFRNTAGRKLDEFWDRVGNKAAQFGEKVAIGVVAALESMGLIEQRSEDFADKFTEAMQKPQDGLTDLGKEYEKLLRLQNRDVTFGLTGDDIRRAAEQVSFLEQRLADLGSETANLAADARGVRVEYDLLNQGALETIGAGVLGFLDPRGSGEEANRSMARLVEDVAGSVDPISLDLNFAGMTVKNPEVLVSGLHASLSEAVGRLDTEEAASLMAEFLSSDFATAFKEKVGFPIEDVLRQSELSAIAALSSAPSLYAEALKPALDEAGNVVKEGMGKIALTLDDGRKVTVERFELIAGQITPIFSEAFSDARKVVQDGVVVLEKDLRVLGEDLSVSITPFGGATGSTEEITRQGAEISGIIEKQTKANEKLLASQEELLRIRKDEAAAMKEGRAKSNAEAEVKLTSVKIKLAKDLLDNKISEYEFSVRSNAVQRAYELEVAKIRSDANARFKAESEDIKKTVASMWDAMIEKAQKLAKQREAALQDEKDLQEVVAQARREGLDSEEKAYAKIDAKFEELTRKALQQTAATRDQINAVLAILKVERLRVVEHQKLLDLQEEQLRGEEYLASVIEAGRQNELNIASAIAHMQGESVGQAYDEIAAIEERVRLRREELAAQVEAGVLTSERAAEEVRNMEALANLDRRRVDENLRLRAIQDGAGAFGESFSYGISTAIDNLQTAGDLGRELGNTFASSMGQFASGLATGSASFESFKNIVIGGLLQIIAKWAVLRIVSGLGFGAAGGTGAAGLDNPTTPGGNYVQLNAKGGVMSGSIVGTTSLPVNAYANGGVASTPQLAIFGEGRGAEAFVPLPDGRRIPVDAGGAFTALSAQMRAMTSMMAGGRTGGSSGGNVISLNVDARGAQDAAGVEAAVERSLMKSMPRIEKALGNSMAAGTSGALTRGVRSASRGR
jgi:TP901 family phage tail tape measure protein